MININFHDITLIYHETLPISYLYKGTLLLWEAVSSCFGSGYWRNDLPWSNEDAWKNEK